MEMTLRRVYPFLHPTDITSVSSLSEITLFEGHTTNVMNCWFTIMMGAMNKEHRAQQECESRERLWGRNFREGFLENKIQGTGLIMSVA